MGRGYPWGKPGGVDNADPRIRQREIIFIVDRTPSFIVQFFQSNPPGYSLVTVFLKNECIE